MKFMKKDGFTFLHPLFFGIFPLLFLYAHNAGEMTPGDIAVPLLVAAGFAVFVTFGAGIILKDFRKSALIATMILFVYFSYGHIAGILPSTGFALFGTIPVTFGSIFTVVCLGLLAAGIFIVIRTKKNLGHLTTILVFIGACLVFFQIVQAGAVLVTRKKAADVEVTQESTGYSQQEKKSTVLPDIYFIIMDGYTGKDILETIFHVDNTDFYAFLREKGFHVPGKSFSNYCQTVYSAAATLNMSYIQDIGDFGIDSRDRMPVSARLRDNAVVRFLKSAGYTIAAFSSGYYHTRLDNTDYYFSPESEMSEFENILINTTLFPLNRDEEDSAFAKHRQRILYTLDKLAGLDMLPSPKFVFAHILSPHPPFVFTAEGEPTRQSDFFHMCDGSHYMSSTGGGLANYIKGYGGQITWITKLLKKTIQQILERNTEHPPVIILQADHGSGSGLSWESLEKTNVHERFSILNAWYLPGYEDNDNYRISSPVNTFRVVFNTYFGTRFPLLEDRHYYAAWASPHDYKDVTDVLYGEDPGKQTNDGIEAVVRR